MKILGKILGLGFAVGFILLVVTGGGLLGNFVKEDIAIRATETYGFSEVRVLDKDVWWVNSRGCGRSDVAKFDVQAVNSLGKEVHLMVCSGWPFKGATVRTR